MRSTACALLYSMGLAAMVSLLTGCERPSMETVQRGYRGNGMELVINPRLQAEQIAKNEAPESLPPASSDGPRAAQVYQNVKVLGHLSAGEFTRTMVSITNWVAPQQGCTYCHNPANFADDSLYTKVVARRMLQMTQRVNADWKPHVGATGVTCYTCHRGNPVPAEVWFAQAPSGRPGAMLGSKAGQNEPALQVGYTSLPSDPFSTYLLGAQEVRVAAKTALPDRFEKNPAGTMSAEHTYGLMMHFSKSLGVNCTYCHNTRAMGEWTNNPVTRQTAWYGIRMVRELNTAFLDPLGPVYPAQRLGELGDAPKANCATCHQGAYKPLYGASMLAAHPELASYPGASKVAANAVTATAGSGDPKGDKKSKRAQSD